MASIITATTTSGLTQSADNSGVLQLASGTGNLVTVPSVTGTAMVSGNMPAFSANSSASQTVSSTTFTKVLFATEDWDTANCYDTSTSRFTPNVAGYYQVNTNVAILTSATEMLLSIYKNGVIYKQIIDINSSFTINGSIMVYLNGSTDYIEVYIWLGTGQGLSTNSQRMTFQATLVRAA